MHQPRRPLVNVLLWLILFLLCAGLVAGWLLRARRRIFGDYAFVPDYRSHPDQRQEDFFFGLLRMLQWLRLDVVAKPLLPRALRSAVEAAPR